MSVHLLTMAEVVGAAEVNDVDVIVVSCKIPGILDKYSDLFADSSAEDDVRLIQRVSTVVEYGNGLHATEAPFVVQRIRVRQANDRDSAASARHSSAAGASAARSGAASARRAGAGFASCSSTDRKSVV